MEQVTNTYDTFCSKAFENTIGFKKAWNRSPIHISSVLKHLKILLDLKEPEKCCGLLWTSWYDYVGRAQHSP